MSFWILYGLLTSLLVLISYMVKAKNQQIISYIILGLMIVVSGFRYRIGYDYDQYMNMYSWISYDPNMVWPEPSFQILCQFLRYLGFEFQMLFLLYAIVSLVFFYIIRNFYIRNDRLSRIVVFVYNDSTVCSYGNYILGRKIYFY